MDDEINLLDYWRVIVRRKTLIVGLTLICAFLALVFSLTQPKLYKATVTIMPVDTGSGGLASALAAVPFLAVGGSSGGEAKLMPILESNSLATGVAQGLDINLYLPKLAKDDKMTVAEKTRSFANCLRQAVEAKSRAGLLNVSIIWPKPEQAAFLANRYVEQLGKFLNNRSLNVNFQTIDLAVSPMAKFKPRTKLNTIVGLVLGLFIGIFVAIFLEYLKKASTSCCD